LIAMWGMYEHCVYLFRCRILCIFSFFFKFVSTSDGE